MIMARAAAKPHLHSVISGRVVSPGGRPVNARLLLTKRFRTPLGRGNPSGRRFVVERLSTSMRSGRNGGFVWHVNPSTRPIVASEGGRESYTLKVASRAGCRSFHVRVGRGQRVSLGTIRLENLCAAAISEGAARDPLPLPRRNS
jgi:hypothetical protein